MALAKEWTDGKENKDDFAKYVLNSGALLDRLIEIIDKKVSEIVKAEDNDDFTSPAWAMQQAHRQGRRKALNEIRKLLDRG